MFLYSQSQDFNPLPARSVLHYRATSGSALLRLQRRSGENFLKSSVFSSAGFNFFFIFLFFCFFFWGVNSDLKEYLFSSTCFLVCSPLFSLKSSLKQRTGGWACVFGTSCSGKLSSYLDLDRSFLLDSLFFLLFLNSLPAFFTLPSTFHLWKPVPSFGFSAPPSFFFFFSPRAPSAPRGQSRVKGEQEGGAAMGLFLGQVPITNKREQKKEQFQATRKNVLFLELILCDNAYLFFLVFIFMIACVSSSSRDLELCFSLFSLFGSFCSREGIRVLSGDKRTGRRSWEWGGHGRRRRSHASSPPCRVLSIIHTPGPELRSDWLPGIAFIQHSAALFANIPHSKPCSLPDGRSTPLHRKPTWPPHCGGP